MLSGPVLWCFLFTLNTTFKANCCRFLTTEPFHLEPLYVLTLIIIWFSRDPVMFWKWASKVCLHSAAQRQVWRGVKVAWTVWKVQLVTTQTASRLICRNKCADGLKVAYIEQECTGTVWLSWKSTVNIVRGFNGQTYAYFLLQSSRFDKAQIHSVSSIKHREEGGRRWGVSWGTEVRFCHGTEQLFYWRGKTQETSCFHSCMSSPSVGARIQNNFRFWEIRGQLAFPQPCRN